MQRRSRVQADNPVAVSAILSDSALQSFYEENLVVIYRFVYSKVGNREEAEDLTSQVFIKALRGLDVDRDAQSMQSWLFQVARTTIADHWRQFYRLHSDSLDDLLTAGWEAPAPAEKSEEEPNERVQRLLDQLPARYREVLTYRFLLNYSIKETAEKMRLTEANVKVLQFRALKKAAQLDEGHV
jgi:RNA polymerase sigma-70 factor, ECF subfamily